MKRHIPNLKTSSRQGGAVIIVVIALMTTLVILGLFTFQRTSQEVANAELFSSPNESRSPDSGNLFDQSLEQLIVGTPAGKEDSVLWGGMHSMLAHEIGRIDQNLKPVDTSVKSGQGIVIRYKDAKNTSGASSPDGLPDVVYDSSNSNFGGFADVSDFQFIYSDEQPSPSTLPLNIQSFVMNFSRMAQDNRNADAFNQSTPIPYYRPDVGYTYPDINSLFLAYDEIATDPNNSSAGSRRVLVPSFFRPVLFPEMRSVDGSNSFIDLYTNPDYRKKTFRPSVGHRYSNGDQRYLTAPATMAQSGDRGRVIEAFPFPIRDADAQMGIYSTPHISTNYTLLDTDLDNDGIKDSIWMDLDLPMHTFSDGSQFVPLASFKVIDADGLVNLNVHGNLQGLALAQGGLGRLGASRTVTSNLPISISNLGMSRSEVNPLWALSGDVSTLSSNEQQNALKNTADRFGFDPSSFTPNRITLANMEFAMMLQGWKPGSGETEVLGRYGDRTLLISGTSPRAGAPTTDDDNDNSIPGGFGQPKTDTDNLNGLVIPGFVHPLSPVGLGMPAYGALSTPLSFQNTSQGATRVLKQLITNNPAAWPQYVDYQALSSTPYQAGLMLKDTNTDITALLQDEDDETILEPGNANFGAYDEPYPSTDAAFLQLGDLDQYRAGISSRLATLASANFQHVKNAEEIRRQFTTDSWDRLEFNFSAPLFRRWEWGNSNQFPPAFTVSGQAQPFRQEIRDLMRTDFQQVNHYGATRVSPRQRLNLNQILSNDLLSGGSKGSFENASPRYRDLVPHPSGLTGDKTILSLPMYHGDGGTTAVDPRLAFTNLTGSDTYLQEWWARYDRQRLARDIYCLLWVLGNGNDGTSTNNFLNTNPYSAAQA